MYENAAVGAKDFAVKCCYFNELEHVREYLTQILVSAVLEVQWEVLHTILLEGVGVGARNTVNDMCYFVVLEEIDILGYRDATNVDFII